MEHSHFPGKHVREVYIHYNSAILFLLVLLLLLLLLLPPLVSI